MQASGAHAGDYRETKAQWIKWAVHPDATAVRIGAAG